MSGLAFTRSGTPEPPFGALNIGSWPTAQAARERMICVSHGLVSIDLQTPCSESVLSTAISVQFGGLNQGGLSAGPFPWRGKSPLVGEGDRLGAVACVNLGEQVVDVAFDGAFADGEVFGDLAVRHAGGDQ
jgi:hypothetical protein